MRRAAYALLALLGLRWLVKIQHDDEYAGKWARRFRL